MYNVDSGEKQYVFDAFDLMRVDYRKVEIRFAVCTGCRKIYKFHEKPEICCEGEEYESYRVADIVGENYNFAIERKQGQDLASSLHNDRLYTQLALLRDFFGSCSALVFEGSFEKLILDPNNKSRVGQIMSIPATCAQYGVSFIQVNDITTLIRMLKYFNEKCGKEPKIRTSYHPMDENLPFLTRLLVGGIKGINTGLAGNINKEYVNVLDLSMDLANDNLRKIPKIGPKMEKKLKQWLT